MNNSNKVSKFYSSKIVLSVLVLIVFVIAAAVFFTHGISDAAREELAAIKSGNMNAAYSMTSKAFQSQTTLDHFNRYVEKFPILKNYSEVTFTDRNIENGMGYLKGTIQGANGNAMEIEFQLVKEDNKWKIQALRLTKMNAEENTVQQSTTTMTTDNSNTMIHNILVNDKADKHGYTTGSKATLSKAAPKIFATIEIIAPKGHGQVEALLLQPDGSKIGPSTGKITKSGKIMKAFAFTRAQDQWPAGEYTLTVTTSSGVTKSVSFIVE